VLADQRQRRALECHARQIAVGGGAVPDNHRTTLEYCTPDGRRGIAEPLECGLDCRVRRQRVEFLRTGPLEHRLVHPLGDRVPLLVCEDDQALGLDLKLAAAPFDLALEPDDVALVDLGVRADARLLEGRTVDGSRLVAQLEHRRAGRLPGGDDLALEANALANPVGK